MNTPSERAGWSRAELERVIKPLRRLLVAEREHAKRIRKEERKAGRSIGPIDVMSSRYAADLAHADLLSVTVADCDAIMALAPPSSLDGVMVPREPTEAMAAAGHDAAYYQGWIGKPTADSLCDVYRAMVSAALAAAPLPVGKQGVSSSRDLGSDAGSALDLDELHVQIGLHLGEWPGFIDCDAYLSDFGPETVDKLIDLARLSLCQSLPQPPVQQTDSEGSRAESPSPPLADGEPETP